MQLKKIDPTVQEQITKQKLIYEFRKLIATNNLTRTTNTTDLLKLSFSTFLNAEY